MNAKGIFDRTKKGTRLSAVSVALERGRIRFFARTLGETSPIYFDTAAAKANGYPDIVAPPSFFMVIEATANEERERRGEMSVATLFKCDYRYLLHGDEHYDYRGLMFAGDEVSLTTTVSDFYDKKGGAVEFVTIESELTHAARGTLISAKRTLLHRLG
jgi:hypothetical protein